ncbi:MAG TPA: hypothetical protein VLB04_10725 [Methanotrichaceae archaeon]|nr:hypothetical protein [Methanotrichaceae archaeon]
MKLLLTAALVLMLSSLALAASETEQLGPYTVTFDMNTPMQYQVQAQEPIETPYSTIYSLRISTDDTTGAGIGITEYKDKTDSTLSVAKQLTFLQMALRGFNVTAAPEDLTIDGRNGFLIAGEPVSEATNAQQPATLFNAGYWLDSMDCECGPVSVGSVNVGISSTYPEDVTRNLVNTLMVASGQAPVQAMAGQQQMTQQTAQVMPTADASQMPPQ